MTFLPYGRQTIETADIEAVSQALTSGWLTTGPGVGAFEEAVAAFCDVSYGVAVSSGTAALHTAYAALGIGPGDEVIVPAITFAATANAVLYCGATPVFADVDPETLLVDPDDVARKITPRTRAVVAVDYAGQPCDYRRLQEIAERRGLDLVADSCHALGAGYQGRPVGSLARCTVFSFHPVKHITTGEGGMVVTDDAKLAGRMRRFRNHGIDTDHRQREESGTHAYAMTELGWNYRLADINCALGRAQLQRLPAWLEKRRQLAAAYDRRLAAVPGLAPLERLPERDHAYHLYVVRLEGEQRREAAFTRLRRAGIGANVHYLPVYLHPYYQRLGYAPGLCPRAEAAYRCILTLPLFPGMEEDDVDRVAAVLEEVA